MKRGFRASQPTRAFTALAAVLVLLALAACTPTGTQSVKVTPTAQALYPRVKTYPDIRVASGVTYASPDGAPQELDVCLPKAGKADDGPRAAVLSIHGGSWRTGLRDSINWRSVCQWLASSGFVTFSVGYRLAPQFSFPAAIDDVKSAVRWMRDPAVAKRYDIDPERIGVFGGSAGGNLAALLGTSGEGGWTTGTRVAAVAELSGPSDLTATGSELPDFVPLELEYLGCQGFSSCPQAREASPIDHIDPSDPPFFIAHSLRERIPLSQSADFVKQLRKRKVDTTFVTVKGSLHSIAMLNPELRTKITTFFADKLAAR